MSSAETSNAEEKTKFIKEIETPNPKNPTEEKPYDNGNSKDKDIKKKKKKKKAIELLDDDVVLVNPSPSRDSKEVLVLLEEEEEMEKSGSKRKGRVRDRGEEEEEEEAMCRFPTARIKRIIKGDDPDLQAGRDVVFLVNKATEKFLVQFSEEAYQCSVRDKKKALAYKHLSSVVAQDGRFDFLRDYVPEKLKARDALTERKLAETIPDDV